MGTPFRTRKANCPACKEAIEVTFMAPPSSGYYRADKIDKDKFVIKWMWEEHQYRDLNPDHYLLWFCPKCYYSDFREEFEGQNLVSKIEHIRPLFFKDKESPNSLVQRIGQNVCLEPRDLTSAFHLFYLALYIQELIPLAPPTERSAVQRDWTKLGRLYMRLGWLFREKANKDKGHVVKTKDQGNQAFYDGCLTRLKQFARSLHGPLNQVQEFEDYCENARESQETVLNDQFFQELTELKQGVQALNPAFKTLHEQVQSLLLALKSSQKDNAEALKASEQVVPKLIHDLSMHWSLAENETECMERAMKYFRVAADFDEEMDQMVSLNLMNMVSDICLRLGRSNAALKVLQDLRRRCDKLRMELTQNIKRKAGRNVDDLEKKKEEITKLGEEISFKAQDIKEGKLS